MGAIGGETGRWERQDSECIPLCLPVMEIEIWALDVEGALVSWKSFSFFLVGDSRTCIWYIEDNEPRQKER